MNLSEVNTPAELLEQNNEPQPPNTSQLDALTENLGLEETYELALNMVQRLGSFHLSVVEDLKEQGNELDRLVTWVQDEQKLHTAYDLIRQVYESE